MSFCKLELPKLLLISYKRCTFVPLNAKEELWKQTR